MSESNDVNVHELREQLMSTVLRDYEVTLEGTDAWTFHDEVILAAERMGPIPVYTALHLVSNDLGVILNKKEKLQVPTRRLLHLLEGTIASLRDSCWYVPMQMMNGLVQAQAAMLVEQVAAQVANDEHLSMLASMPDGEGIQAAPPSTVTLQLLTIVEAELEKHQKVHGHNVNLDNWLELMRWELGLEPQEEDDE
jgi:hypothetical protein